MLARFVLLLTTCLLSLALPLRAQTLPAKAPRTDRYGDPLPPGATARLGTVRWRNGTRDIKSLRYSSDGRTLLSVETDASVRVWDAATGKQYHTFTIPQGDYWVLTSDF